MVVKKLLRERFGLGPDNKPFRLYRYGGIERQNCTISSKENLETLTIPQSRVTGVTVLSEPKSKQTGLTHISEIDEKD